MKIMTRWVLQHPIQRRTLLILGVDQREDLPVSGKKNIGLIINRVIFEDNYIVLLLKINNKQIVIVNLYFLK